ncbi:hypothetical protein BJ878DRAFT_193317 [Calycina marina]|uniref:RRM domain-containing protein n=1 Tax=Calycina marina TaxID=1763456 RepID=A0A9P7YYE7_9HELO|nr:hypothetical protein BJ878DRAFT_193317 [Calycina marina]
MVQVAAGDITGLYYIPVANLPWGCTWQMLKDFARNSSGGELLDIDHALVNSGSKTGWVRVKGKENFRKALTHLNGGVLEHRCMIADGRNEMQTLTLCDTVAGPPPQRHQGSSSNSIQDTHQSPTISQSYYGMTSPSKSAYAVSEASTCHSYYTPQLAHLPSPMYNSSAYELPAPNYEYLGQHTSQSHISYVHPATSLAVYAGNLEPYAPVYVSSPPAVTYSIPSSYTEPSLPQPPPTSTSTLAMAEARKIVITQLQYFCTTADIQDLLYTAMANYSASYHYELEDLEVIKNSNGTSKGHAFAILSSYDVACYVVDSLNGCKFKGRTLQVRFAKEGVDPSYRHFADLQPAFSSPMEDRRRIPPSSKRASKSGKEKDVSSDRRSSSSGRQESRASDRKSTKDLQNDKKKHRSKPAEPATEVRAARTPEPPLVVDGSSNRKHRK